MMLARSSAGRSSSSRLIRRRGFFNLCSPLGGQDDIIHGRCRDDGYEGSSDAKFSYPILNNNCSSSIYRRDYSTAASASMMIKQQQSTLWNNDHNIYQQQQQAYDAPSHNITHTNNITTNIRCMSSSPSISEQLTSYLPPTPEFLANATIWGEK